MFKYAALTEYLASHPGKALRASFRDIERILRAPLPPSARKRPSWWSNNPDRHAQAQAWLNAGWETSAVDVKRECLNFVKRAATAPAGPPRWEDVYGTLKGVVTIKPGVDLTEPAWPEWADFLDRKYGPEVKRRGARR